MHTTQTGPGCGRVLALFFALAAPAAADPSWWSDPSFSIWTSTPQNVENGAPVNLGQLKNVADQARRYLDKFDQVEQKMALVEEADRLRNFQPMLTGEMIMEVFGLSPGKEVGIIKEQIREAILEGQIRNSLAECLFLALQLGLKLELSPINDFDGQAFLDRFPE